MAFDIKLLNISKRPNSTKQPDSTQLANATVFSCVLKDGTSLYKPTFLLEYTSNPIGFNYAYVSEFDRYYFIREIISDHNMWSISCEADPMASFKTTIGSGSHYVMRSAAQYDGYISDNMYGAKVDVAGTKGSFSPNPFFLNTNSSFIVGIVGNAPSDSQQAGSITYYQCDKTAMQNFIYYLMHHINDWCDIPTALYDTGVQEALLNPIQYIVSCVVVPVGLPASFTQASTIQFGYYSMPVPSSGYGSVRILNVGETQEEDGIATLVKHPQAATRGAYLNGAPFMYLTAHFGPFGDIPLDPADYIDADKVAYSIKYDLAQGIGRLAIGPAIYDDVLARYKLNPHKLSFCGTSQVGVPIQLSQAIIDPLKAQLSWETGLNNTVATGVGSGLTTGILSNLLNAQNTLQETYADAIRNKFPTVQSKSNPGSFINLKDADFSCYLLQKYYTVIDEDNAEIGRPLCKVKTINTLSGYILCKNAECPISGTREEQEKINTYLNTGFFYE